MSVTQLITRRKHSFNRVAAATAVVKKRASDPHSRYYQKDVAGVLRLWKNDRECGIQAHGAVASMLLNGTVWAESTVLCWSTTMASLSRRCLWSSSTRTEKTTLRSSSRAMMVE